MENAYRNGRKWSVPEILRLQREWELLQLSIQEIAKIHGRTERAIQMKLLQEEFVSSDKYFD